MSTGFALWNDGAADLGWGQLTLHEGLLRLHDDGASEGSAVQLDPVSAPYVDVYVHDDWLCALGGADRHLILGRRDPLELASIAELDRTSTSGAGFEFENHSVRFHDRPAHRQCLLAWELGLALIDPIGGLRWSYLHGDVNQRVLRITPETATLRGLYQTISIRLVDGTATTSVFRSPPSDDTAVLAAFMRQIGR